jgi:two-component system sensor histidine kinase HydH
MDTLRLNEVLGSFALDDGATRTLAAFYESTRDEIPSIVDEFIDFIGKDPQVARLAQGRPIDLHCLKPSLVNWLNTTLSSPRDTAEYLESRRRIGKVHVQIELPQEMMFTAMNCIRSRLMQLALRNHSGSPNCAEMLLAINRALDLELTLMIESYREHQQEQLKTHERLATIGQLAASIGHELRNPLGTIETSVYLLAQRLAKVGFTDESVSRHVDKARKQVHLCSKIISDLLELARSRPPRRKRINVASVIDEAVEALQLPESILVSKSVSADLSVLADPEQLRSVIVNLLENGRDAISGSGQLGVKACAEKSGVSIRVRDSGPGIAVADRLRIFEPLFTTKAHGNGLGLALCRRIVVAHGGSIEVEPSDSGASFHVWLPEHPE